MNQAERDALIAEWETIKRLTGFPTVSPIGNPTMTLSLMGLAERLALALSASRPVGEVETIARIIEPAAWIDFPAPMAPDYVARRAPSLTKARAILALLEGSKTPSAAEFFGDDGALASTANASTGHDIDPKPSPPPRTGGE